MDGTLTGGCLCGAVRYKLNPGFRMRPYVCHCTDCQRQTGASFNFLMNVMEKDLEIEGDLNEGRSIKPSGAVSRIMGCAKCMSRIYAVNAHRPGLAGIRVGTLDNSKEISPAAHIWIKSKQPWIIIADDVPTLETQPQSSEEWLQFVGPDNLGKN